MHTIVNLALHNRACLDIVALAYYTGMKICCCCAWDNNHCFIYVKVYTKTQRSTGTKMFFLICVRQKHLLQSWAFYIELDYMLSPSAVTFISLLHSSLFLLHPTATPLLTPQLLPHFTPFSFLFISFLHFLLSLLPLLPLTFQGPYGRFSSLPFMLNLFLSFILHPSAFSPL